MYVFHGSSASLPRDQNISATLLKQIPASPLVVSFAANLASSCWRLSLKNSLCHYTMRPARNFEIHSNTALLALSLSLFFLPLPHPDFAKKPQANKQTLSAHFSKSAASQHGAPHLQGRSLSGALLARLRAKPHAHITSGRSLAGRAGGFSDRFWGTQFSFPGGHRQPVPEW